jgi:AmmeMemoRadiSam system protein A
VTAETLSVELRRALLALARAAIEAQLRGGHPQPQAQVPEELRRNRGAFVTLRRRADHELRGCVGFVEPLFPLCEAVARAAVAAATQDGRFAPVEAGELPQLALDISVLGLTRPIAAADVEVGVHGLIVRWAGRGGLLLPQVAVEHGWSREAFLDHTCLKAGLPAATWRRADAELLAFEAEVFGEW